MSAKGNITVRYAVLQGLYWVNYCIIGGFAAVYLLDHGFSNALIGIIVSVSGILSAAISPVIAAYADKPESLSVKKLMTIMAAGMVVLMVLILLTGKSAPLTVIAYTAGLMLAQLMASFTSSLATQSMRSGWEINFGIARGTGSVTYGIMAQLLGAMVARWDPDILPICGIAAWSAMLLALLLFPETKDPAVLFADIPEEERSGTSRRHSGSPIDFFRRYPRYGCLLLGLFLVYISHSLNNVFVTQIAISKGGTNADTGLILGIQAYVELPVMLAFSFMLKKVKVHNWMRICAIFYVMKIIGTYAVSSIAGLAAVQILEMGSYAVHVTAGLYYINSLMDSRDLVKGQAYLGLSTTLANAAASMAGGFAIDAVGIDRTLFIGIFIASVGAIIMFFSAEDGSKSRKVRGVK